VYRKIGARNTSVTTDSSATFPCKKKNCFGKLEASNHLLPPAFTELELRVVPQTEDECVSLSEPLVEGREDGGGIPADLGTIVKSGVLFPLMIRTQLTGGTDAGWAAARLGTSATSGNVHLKGGTERDENRRQVAVFYSQKHPSCSIKKTTSYARRRPGANTYSQVGAPP